MRWVGLLRAVNVGGRKLPMAELRDLFTELGWSDVSTYIQTGNLIFSANGSGAALEAALEQAIESRFAMTVPAIVRSASQWFRIASEPAFPTVARDDPSRLMLLLAKQAPAPDSAEKLQQRAAAGERVERVGEVLWLHFPAGVGTSKLTPSLIDRTIGSPTTTRNYRTVRTLQERLAS